MTQDGAKKLTIEAVTAVMVPVCARAILADPAATSALLTKKPHDVVRENGVRLGVENTSWTFSQDCAKAIEKLQKGRASKT